MSEWLLGGNLQIYLFPFVVPLDDISVDVDGGGGGAGDDHDEAAEN